MRRQLWWLLPLTLIWLFGMWMTTLYLRTVDQALVVPASSAITSLDDLGSGDVLGVTDFTQGAFYAEQTAPDGVKFEEFDQEAATVAALRAGDVDGIVAGLPAMEQLVESDPDLVLVETFSTAVPTWPVVVLLIGNVVTFTVTAFVGIRRPEVRIGQLFTFATAGFAVSVFLLSEIIEFLPPGAVRPIAVLGGVMGPPSLAAVCWVIALFPDGRHASPRWRWISWYLVVYVLVITPLVAWEFATADLSSADTFPEAINTFAFFGALVVLFAGLGSLVVRVRRGDRQTRAQMAWLIYAVAVYGVFLVVAEVFFDFGVSVESAAVDQVFYLPIPIAIAVAIFRYRLYEIDRVVSRSVTYGLVVVAMAGVYVAVVGLLNLVLPVTEDLAVAISTLAAVGVSVPLVRRVRGWVDRRFFRSRYDAAAVVARVADDLRTTVDIDEVERRTGAVVDEVFAPESVGVWIAGES